MEKFLIFTIVGLTEGYLAGYLPGDNQYLASLRPAAAVIILFIALLVVPNPRLRTRGQLRGSSPRRRRRACSCWVGS